MDELIERAAQLYNDILQATDFNDKFQKEEIDQHASRLVYSLQQGKAHPID